MAGEDVAAERIAEAAKNRATSLDLRYLKLPELPQSMSNLTGLTELRLGGNALTELPEWLGTLTRLTVLDLGHNSLSVVPEWLGGLTRLTSLHLSDNGLTELPESLSGLTRLADLYLSTNSLTELPESLGGLTRLVTLDLSGNKLTELPESLAKTRLSSLYLSANALTELPKWLAGMRSLTTLDVGRNSLRELPVWLQSMTRLSTLYLSGITSTELPEWLGAMTGLTMVDLTSLRLTALPNWLRGMTGLVALFLSGNGLTELPDWLGELPALSVLDLSGNRLAELPESLGGMTRLSNLSLSNNPLTALPESLGDLAGLTDLDLTSNRLTDLPESLSNLTRLTTLSLGYNRLAVLPDCLRAATDLLRLDLRGNELKELPEWLGDLTKLTDLAIGGNPLTSPPPEILAGGLTAILSFLRATATSPSVRLWESKVLVVGEATVGKTSMTKQLTGGHYDPHESQTHGVHVERLPLPHPTEPDTVMELTTWDFGGQLEYRATQRFYLTDRSLFLLVWNSRARWRDGKLTAWLDVITARAPGSPILVVGTHSDESSAATLPQDLVTRYPRIAGIHQVDAKTPVGVDELREVIRQQAAGLPLMGMSWPEPWAEAAKAVRGLEGFAATASQVWAAMARAGVEDRGYQQIIASALHDLGDVVFFADDPILAQRMILHPDWLDARITQVLDSQAVADARGVMSRAERDRLWGDLDDPDLLDRLIRMMERFDLAYRLGDADDSENVALVVERLGDSRPAEVDVRWQQARELPGMHEIGLAYKLKSRQAGIPTWFIARQHRYTTGLHWAHGALLHDHDVSSPSYALLVDDEREQPTITLSVRGGYPVTFLSVLAEAFENILDNRYPGLIERKLVPCSCQQPPAPSCAHLFGFDELKLVATDTDEDANYKVFCPISEQKLDARVMLDGLHGSTTAKRLDGIERALAVQSTTLNRIDAQGLATLNAMRSLLADRAQFGAHCPSLFAVEDLGRSGLLRRREVRLRLWCEWPYGPSGPHALDGDAGVYTIKDLPAWLRNYLPYLRVLIQALGAVAPVIAPALIVGGANLSERARAGFEVVDKTLEAFGDIEFEPGPASPRWQTGHGPQRRAEVGADFRTLRAALRSLDPQEDWGGLTPVPRPEDRRIVYLCRDHVRELEFPYGAVQHP